MSTFLQYKKILFAFGIALIVLSFILVLNRQDQNVLEEELSLWREEEKVLVFEVVDTPQERSMGLSGRQDLEEGRAMLFIFDTPDMHGIWMRDMLFSIDIVWLTSTFEVVNFKESVSPETFPTVFKPTTPALYVIEAHSGFVEEQNIKIGEILDIKQEVVQK